ncbi:MAG: 2-dehydropantoate 2-reductase [Proteobacteria bacterium]|nr:2-dehydropantoate 2-reductase [Pseudomonadota bacterium]
MRIAVVGAGAIGAYVGVRLALAGEQVTFVARGANLEALRSRGARLLLPDGSEQVASTVAVAADCASAGTQDVVILAVKAHQLGAIARDVPSMFGPDTTLVPMQNGIPYWYFHGHAGPHAGRPVEAVDPGGVIAAALAPRRVVGCVVYPATELVAPGVVRLVEGDRFPLGEPDGSRSERVERIATSFERAGFKAPVLDDIRSEIWLKLWGNLTFNPISALTRATLVELCEDPGTRQLAVEMMTEAQDVARAFGVTMRVPLEKRIAGAARVGHHKTSMLQDVEAGRALEVDALLGSVVELARLAGIATPHLDAVYALTRLLGSTTAAQAQRAPVAAHRTGTA